jgi:hypothetical protein
MASRAITNLRGSKKARTIALALAGLFVVVAAPPSFADPPRANPISMAQAVRQSPGVEIIGPMAAQNYHESFSSACRTSAWIKGYPIWYVSHVTSSSVYVTKIEVKFYPGRNYGHLGNAVLTDGYSRQFGFWPYESGRFSTSGTTRTRWVNKTIPFGTNNYIQYRQILSIDIYPDEPGGCGGSSSSSLYFRLKPI